MKKLLVILCAMTLFFGMVGSVSATTITYDFTNGTDGLYDGNVNGAEFIDITSDGVATAEIDGVPPYTGSEPTVTWRTYGLGVKYPDGGDPRIDTSDGNDYLHITFVNPMLMVGATFGRWGDEFNDDDGSVIREMWDLLLDDHDDPIIQDSTDNPWDGEALLASTFTFRADGDSAGFSLATLTVQTVQPVPEPASILLLGAGMIGLAGFRRKFRK
jgi:hypothetical protein